MAADVIELAEAVAEAIGVAFPYVDWTIERKYVPVNRVAELDTPIVSVVPAETSDEPITRNSDQYTQAIDVAYQEHVSDLENSTLDPRILSVQQIGDVFRGRKLTLDSGVEATCTRTSIAPLFDRDHLDQKRVFTSVMRLTFWFSKARP